MNDSWEGVTHRLKLADEYISPVSEGRKTFEVRLNDRSYMVGDRIVFLWLVSDKWVEVDTWPTWEITYILESFVGLADGYVAFSIEEVNEVAK